MSHNLLINEEKWSDVLDVIGAKKSSRLIVGRNISPEHKRLVNDGVKYDELDLVRGEWKSEKPFIDSNGNVFVLYIYDQSLQERFNHNNHIETGFSTYKYHVCWCCTLETMNQIGRRARYKAKYDISNAFFNVCRGDSVDENLQMHVCKNCLREMNYDGYENAQTTKKNEIYNEFAIESFFDDYQSVYLPQSTHQNHTGRYTSDWSIVSKRIRNDRGNVCEECGSGVGLHVHHVNGVRDDNSPRNLKVLCWRHHAQQPMHGHMTREF